MTENEQPQYVGLNVADERMPPAQSHATVMLGWVLVIVTIAVAVGFVFYLLT